MLIGQSTEFRDMLAQMIASGTVPFEIPAVPDRELIATLVANGMPRESAVGLRSHGQQRLHALRFWCDLADAQAGDKEARARVDYVREGWRALRAGDTIAGASGGQLL